MQLACPIVLSFKFIDAPTKHSIRLRMLSLVTWISTAMDCENTSKKPLTDCTNTPISRPRRSCGSYSSSKRKNPVKSSNPKNPPNDAENSRPLAGFDGSSSEQTVDPFRAKSNLSSEQKFTTPRAVLPAAGSFQFPEVNEDGGRNARVYGKRRQKEGRSSEKVPASCLPLGRPALERIWKTVKSSKPENQLDNYEDFLASAGSSYDQHEDSWRVENCEQNIITPQPPLPSVSSFLYADSNEDSKFPNVSVYRKRQQNESSSAEKIYLSCPPLVRKVPKRKQNTSKSSEPKNPWNDVEDSITQAGGSHEQNEASLRGNDKCKQSLSTPLAVLPTVDNFKFPDRNEDADVHNTRFHGKWQQWEGRRSEKVSLSCPPFGRAVLESSGGKRSGEVRKRYSVDGSDVLPELGKPKKKVQRRQNSVSTNEGKYSLPDDFVRQQQAHFAEVDAFILQEEDLLDAD